MVKTSNSSAVKSRLYERSIQPSPEKKIVNLVSTKSKFELLIEA